MIKLAFKLYAFIAILSPWIFFAARLAGKYNFQYDSAVFALLFLVSGAALFLTYKNWD